MLLLRRDLRRSEPIVGERHSRASRPLTGRAGSRTGRRARCRRGTGRRPGCRPAACAAPASPGAVVEDRDVAAARPTRRGRTRRAGALVPVRAGRVALGRRGASHRRRRAWRPRRRTAAESLASRGLAPRSATRSPARWASLARLGCAPVAVGRSSCGSARRRRPRRHRSARRRRPAAAVPAAPGRCRSPRRPRRPRRPAGWPPGAGGRRAGRPSASRAGSSARPASTRSSRATTASGVGSVWRASASRRRTCASCSGVSVGSGSCWSVIGHHLLSGSSGGLVGSGGSRRGRWPARLRGWDGAGRAPGSPARRGPGHASGASTCSRPASRVRPREHRDFTVPYRAVEHLGGLRDGVALHVHQHQRGPLLGGQPRAGPPPPVGDVRRPAPRRRGRARPRWSPATHGRRSSSRSSGSGSARRTFAARSRSRQALTTTRCSQVVTCASPRNEPGPAVRRDQPVLEAVGRVVGVAHGAHRDRPEPVAVAARTAAPNASASPGRARRAARRRCARPRSLR